jgi:hypothetical protein
MSLQLQFHTTFWYYFYVVIGFFVVAVSAVAPGVMQFRVYSLSTRKQVDL